MSDPVVLLSTGDVVGPAGGVTDNSMVLFSGTSGKLIKGNNAVVTAAGLALLDDVNAAAQMVTLGLTATATELNYTDGVTSAIQTQLNGKAPLTGAGTSGTWGISITGSAAWASGVDWSGVSSKPTTLGGYGITNGYAMDGVNTGWFRSSGGNGWYNVTYDGGIHMTDSTYVRTYNNKSFLCNDAMRVEGAAPQIQLWDSDHSIVRFLYANGGDIGFLSSSGNWMLRNDDSGNLTAAGNITAGGAVNATNLLGQGQTWQDLTGSRMPGVTYTNSTGRPIVVSIGIKSTSGNENVYFRVNGVVVSYHENDGAGDSIGPVGNIVPAGATYSLNKSVGTIENWAELR